MDISKLNTSKKKKMSLKQIISTAKMGLGVAKVAVKPKDKKRLIIAILLLLTVFFYGLTSIVIDIIKIF